MAETEAWSAECSLKLQQSIREDAGLSMVTKSKGLNPSGSPAWKDDKFLTPFLENDSLLYSFDDEGEDDDVEEFNAADKTSALRELLEGNSHSESSNSTETKVPAGTESVGASELADLTKFFQSLGEDIRDELVSPVDLSSTCDVPAHSSSGSLLQDDGPPEAIDVDDREVIELESKLPKKKNKKDLKVTFAEVAKREARNVNKDYFGSYSAFGIHREMLSDKVWTAQFGALIYNSKLCLFTTFGWVLGLNEIVQWYRYFLFFKFFL